MYLDDRVHIETPEGADLTLSLAGPLPRAFAYGIDLVIRGLVLVLLSVPLMLLGRGGTGIYLLLIFLLEWFYPVLFEVLKQGRTPGKATLGLTVVHGNGAPVSLNGSLVRNLLRTADLFPLFYLTGFVTMLIARHPQRLGDLAADTVVVHSTGRRQQRRTPSHPDQRTAVPDWPLQRNDQLTLLAFAERADGLSTGRRQELALLAYPELDGPSAVEQLLRVAHHIQGTTRGQP